MTQMEDFYYTFILLFSHFLSLTELVPIHFPYMENSPRIFFQNSYLNKAKNTIGELLFTWPTQVNTFSSRIAPNIP